MARNKVDKVLGFSAPRWLDEPFHSRRIDRQKASTDEVELALEDTAREYQNSLATKLLDCASAAARLGLHVVATDLEAAAKQARKQRADIKHFFSHSRDPRDTL